MSEKLQKNLQTIAAFIRLNSKTLLIYIFVISSDIESLDRPVCMYINHLTLIFSPFACFSLC